MTWQEHTPCVNPDLLGLALLVVGLYGYDADELACQLDIKPSTARYWLLHHPVLREAALKRGRQCPSCSRWVQVRRGRPALCSACRHGQQLTPGHGSLPAEFARTAIRRMFAEESTREGGRVVDDRQVEMFGEAAE